MKYPAVAQLEDDEVVLPVIKMVDMLDDTRMVE